MLGLLRTQRKSTFLQIFLNLFDYSVFFVVFMKDSFHSPF